jgi:apolipoprotein N-acyltransferase
MPAIQGPATATRTMPPANSVSQRLVLGRIAAWIRQARGWRADLCALLAGMVTAAALPPVNAVPVLLVTIPVLLMLIAASPRPMVAGRRGFFFGFGLNLLGLYWITDAILFEAALFWWLVPLAVPGLSAAVAMFIAIPAAITRLARPGWPAALALAGSWEAADLVRQFFATGFPWNPLGSVWELPGYPGDVMIQAAAVVGVHGLTLLTLLAAATPLLGRSGRVAGALLLAAWCAFGVVRLNEPAPPSTGLKALLIQGNVAQGQKWNRALMVSIFRHYLDLTRQAVDSTHGKAAVVIWPETASPALLQTDPEARGLIAEAAGGNQSLIGSVRFGPDERPRNSLFALGSDGSIEGIYDKWHLVPFGEYQPDWLPAFLQFIPGNGFAAGPGPQTLHIPGLPPAGALICYEAIFPAQVIDRADRPAWMVNVTNDAWFGNSSGPRQHLAAVRMRAVEEGLPVIRAANTGISAAFDAYGRELKHLGMQKTGYLAVDIPGALPMTPFSRFGLLLPVGLCAVVLFVAFGLQLGSQKSKG